MTPGITAEEFEARYAEGSGITVERLHALGRRARPCRCDSADCEGWQMLSDQNWDAFAQMQAGVITFEEYQRRSREEGQQR